MVLDLNGTILDSTHRRRTGVDHDARARYKYVYFRPGMRDLVRFMARNFTVAVWTSNIRSNALSLVDLAFSKVEQSQLLFIYSRDECQVGANYSSTKPLERIWNEQHHEFNHMNTFIIDDSAEKITGPFAAQCHIQVPTFEASGNPSTENDRGLYDLIQMLSTRFLGE